MFLEGAAVDSMELSLAATILKHCLYAKMTTPDPPPRDTIS
jgi:hypothetical protein